MYIVDTNSDRVVVTCSLIDSSQDLIQAPVMLNITNQVRVGVENQMRGYTVNEALLNLM